MPTPKTVRRQRTIFLLASLLTAALTACGASGDAPAGGTAGGAPGGKPVPAALQGEWRAGTASPSGYYDPSTGAWAGASGSSFILKLAANGSYSYTGLMVVQSGGCESKILSVEAGNATLTADRLDLNPTSGSVQYYLCDPRNIKQGTLQPSHFSWQLTSDEQGKQALLLGDPDGQGRPEVFTRPD